MLVGSPQHRMELMRQHCRGAFFRSLACTTILTMAVGIAFLPRQLRRSLQPSDMHVIDCQTCDAGRLIVMLMRANPATPGAGVHEQLVVSDQAGHPQKMGRPAELTQPHCFAASPNAQSLLVADTADGSIHWVRDRGFSRSIFLGRHSQGVAHTLTLTSDRSTLVSLGAQEICAWDLRKLTLRWYRSDQSPLSVCILPDARTMVCSTSE